jgi:hypothetical protein
VDGGEWLDFAGTDARAFLPRPEPARRAPRDEGRGGEPTFAADDDAPAEAEIIAHPAREPEPSPRAPARNDFAEPEIAEPDFADGPEPLAAQTAEDANYEPDLESRSKFFSRLSRWAKKSG